MGETQQERDQLTRLTAVMERLTDEMSELHGSLSLHAQELRDLKDTHITDLVSASAVHNEKIESLEGFRSHVWWALTAIAGVVGTIVANAVSHAM